MAYPKNPDTIIVKANDYYQEGLTQKCIWHYYDSNKAKIVQELAGGPVVIVTATPGGPVTRRFARGGKPILITNEAQFDAHNNGRNIEFHRTIGDVTSTIGVRVHPSEMATWDSVAETASAVRSALLSFKTWGIVTSFSGSDGIHIRANLPKPIGVCQAKELISNLLNKTVVANFVNVVTSNNHNPDGILLDLSSINGLGSFRVPGSLNAETGLVCARFNESDMHGMEKKRYVVSNFMPASINPHNFVAFAGAKDAWVLKAEHETSSEAPSELNHPASSSTEAEDDGSAPRERGFNMGHGVISSEIAGLTTEQNAERMIMLKDRVDGLKYKWEELDGSWNGIPKKSLLIRNIPENVMQDLTEEFCQEAYVTVSKASSDQADESRRTAVQFPQDSGEEPEQQNGDTPVPPGDEQLLESPPAETPRNAYDTSEPPYDYSSITGHPAFVNAVNEARPIIEKYAPQLKLDPEDTDSVKGVFDFLHNQTKDILGEFLSREKKGGAKPGERESVHDIVQERMVDVSPISALYRLVSGEGLYAYRSMTEPRSDGKPFKLEDYADALEDSAIERELEEGGLRGLSHIIIGTSGFGHIAWLGGFYPRATLQKDRLGLYAKHFKAVEITATRHSTPPTRVLLNWASATPDNFTFAFCAPITVRPSNMVAGINIMRSFMRRIAVIGKKLGPVVLHIGPLEKYASGDAKRFFDALPKHKYAVHVESDAWQNQEVLDELRARDIAAVDTKLGVSITDGIGWSYRRLAANNMEHLSELLHVSNTNYVFAVDKTDRFPSKELLQALHDLGYKLGPDGPMSMEPKLGPVDPRSSFSGGGDSTLPSGGFDEFRSQPLTVLPDSSKGVEVEVKDSDPTHPRNQYPEMDANDGRSDPYGDNVDGRTDTI